ncbi:Hsp33 family molecular chaperone HslO [Sansalvadorimonas verongulae]|uniref:Hsp33 family molecular chaperone HslO n=1 Tax=Sansalvadorimonas verongulae TaxID=2172824 RepID=UPI0012BC1D86|nr:Hsp33 family molecular chaperone HslO [Sansalvadorimonas verongulae]MTI14064.1 Hsp33 family molecular chaperone HslO [Sansalvadorimonas verongulae]
MMLTDSTQRFIFDSTDMRGERVQLDASLQEAFAPHAYPEIIRVLLGELATTAVLLSTTLKFEGKMTLQARSTGPISLLMVECTDERTFRGVARWSDEKLLPSDKNLYSLLENGQLVITIDPTQGKRYQGIVPLDGADLATCFSRYFEQSEQLPTKLWLTCDGNKAAGFLLQALPSQKETDPAARAERWEHLTVLAETLKSEEMLELPTEELLHRLYHEEDVRLFDSESVKYHCNCSRERTGSALITVDPVDIQEILEEQGQVDMDCQFCNTRYTFTEADISKLMGADETRH